MKFRTDGGNLVGDTRKSSKNYILAHIVRRDANVRLFQHAWMCMQEEGRTRGRRRVPHGETNDHRLTPPSMLRRPRDVMAEQHVVSRSLIVRDR